MKTGNPLDSKYVASSCDVPKIQTRITDEVIGCERKRGSGESGYFLFWRAAINSSILTSSVG
jgi:hypothetical protein